jgi:hypothetical protein
MAHIFTTFPHEVTGITGAEHSAQLVVATVVCPQLSSGSKKLGEPYPDGSLLRSNRCGS